jgi:hypothetical protein
LSLYAQSPGGGPCGSAGGCSPYIDLESTADRARLAEPALFLERHAERLVILYEVQWVPELFAELRG